LCTLTVATVLATGSAIGGYAQDQPAAPAPAQPATPQAAAPKPAPPSPEKKPASANEGKTIGAYQVHSMVDLGGRIVEKSGSDAMWATMVNQTSGARVLGQELRMHTIDPHKTPFFDMLNTSSFGYGGDPYDATYLDMGKGNWYDFRSSFRRDRQYFDYNLLVNSLLGPNQLVPQPSSLHLFNTVRRDTDTLLTLFPVSMVSFRAGYNHGTHEGPTFSTIHQGGDVQEDQWFRNAVDTWVGGVDLKVSRLTTLSYDQFFVFYKGDTNHQLAPTGFVLPDTTPASVGVNLLTTTKCGTSGTANYTLAVVNGVINPFCSGTTTQSVTSPTRTSFPTEQFRFASSYMDKLAMNGRFLYSGGDSHVLSFNENFIGLNSRTVIRQQLDTGVLPHGHLADNKRINVNGDFSIRAELTPIFELSDVVNYWDVRVPGNTAWNTFTLTGVKTATGPPVSYGTSMLTPLTDPSLTPNNTLTTDSSYLAHKNAGNTILGTVSVTPQVKLSGGWRFNNREIKVDGDDTLAWHQNWALIGGVVQPSPVFRLSVYYDVMFSNSSNSATTANTYTREAPNKIQNLSGRAQVKPARWINFAVTGRTYYAQNNDPLVNHKEHNNDISFAAQIMPTESMSLDFDFAHDDVFSVTDLCYTASPLPPGAATGGTCTNSADGNSYLGNGYYSAPMTYVNGAFNYSAKYFHMTVGARYTDVGGSAEQLSPYQVPGSLNSSYFSPFADLSINIAREWSWHGNWNRYKYSESGPAGPAPREFNGDVFTLGVKYAF
jgi:nucleoid-associated protein YgaU